MTIRTTTPATTPVTTRSTSPTPVTTRTPTPKPATDTPPAQGKPARAASASRLPAAPTDRSTTSSAAAGPSARRKDIQGLRALAVIAVILHHVIQWPVGGFVGVDVFFVISGFLITGILLREHEATGRISLRTFYTNRMRRILPAAALVLAVTVTVGFVLFNQARAVGTTWDALSSLLFVANWRFTAVGTDYFQLAAAPSVLQHYWSLSVEEQFYLVWPWLMIAVLALAARRARATGHRQRPATLVAVLVGVMAVLLVAASFGYALWHSTAHPAAAYFSTLSRAWELGIGAAAAVALPLLVRIPATVRALLGWVGLAGILVSFAIVTPSLAFPGPWAALPVAATVLVIAAGASGPRGHLVPLTNPVSVYLGNVSFSLYLWHVPVLGFLTLLLPDATPSAALLVLGTTVALSLASYYLVEQPLHASPWLRGITRADGERRSAWRAWHSRFSGQFLVSSLATFVIVMVVAVSVQMQTQGRPPTALESPTTAVDGGVGPIDQLQADLTAATLAATWPDNLSPSLDAAMDATSNTNPARDCFDIGDTPDADRCTWGADDAPNHLFLVGDSEALSYAPTFRALAEASNGQWKVTTMGLYGCRFTAVDVANDGAGVMAACPQRKQDITAIIAAADPRLVVVANAFALGQDTNRTPLTVADLVASAAAETAGYDAAGAVVYLAPPPLGADLGQCYSRVSTPQDCTSTVGATWQEFAEATAAAAAATGDHFLSSLGFSCAAGLCPAFAGTLPVRYDAVHLTPAYAERIAPAIRSELAALGLM